jgi:hypothetical protein
LAEVKTAKEIVVGLKIKFAFFSAKVSKKRGKKSLNAKI